VANLAATYSKASGMMAQKPKLNNPWLIAVWPGMGHVALNAGYYLLAKLGMHVIAEFEVANLFDVDHVEVTNGLIQPVGHPRNRFFLWTDANHKHDIVVFLGEAQPPVGKYAFCHKLIEFARELGVERVFTFAAMATQMHPEHAPRVFGAATDQATLEELKRLELELLQDGNIGGLNGVLLGAATEAGLRGACLLGEMPHIFSQLPFPKASQAILEVFTTIAGIELDFTELKEQVRVMEQQLGDLLAQVEKAYGPQFPQEEESEGYRPEATEEERISAADEKRIDELFEQAKKDRSKAFELKQELDRLGVFKDYEDRFLDLFKKTQ
jgi:proteasome assembly chaperone (PAC2) family protein